MGKGSVYGNVNRTHKGRKRKNAATKNEDVMPKEKFDINKDGNITEEEMNAVRLLHEIDVKIAKLQSQRQMAWLSLFLIAIVTFVLFTPLITEARIDALSDLLGLFYISCAGIVGAYVGVTAWMARK